VDQVLEAVLRVEAVDLAVRVALRVVPQEDVDAVGEEDDGPHAGRLLERVGVLARLLAAARASFAVFFASMTPSGLPSSP
jgi:hypothetical protein